MAVAFFDRLAHRIGIGAARHLVRRNAHRRDGDLGLGQGEPRRRQMTHQRVVHVVEAIEPLKDKTSSPAPT
ncbi:MAG: hypothetical protein WDN48_10765 [Pseudolabrys sp.]